MFDGGVPNFFLELFKGANLNLPNPLPTDVVLLAQRFQGQGIFRQTTFRHDMTLAFVQCTHCIFQKGAALGKFFSFRSDNFLALRIIDQPILPFAVTIRAQRRIERMIRARHAAVHRHHVFFRNSQFIGNFCYRFGVKITIFKRLKFSFQFPQIEKQFFLRSCRANFHQ